MKTLEESIEEVLFVHDQEIAEKVVEKQYDLQPEFWKPYGSRGRKLSIRDAGYHLPFLSEAVLANEPKIFTEYVEWVKVLFRGLNFPDEVMITTLECTKDVLADYLDENQHQLLSTFIDAGISQMKASATVEDSFIAEDAPNSDLAKAYNGALLAGDKAAASKMILKAVEEGTPIKDIYLNVFQVSQYEVGRLWLKNDISVAQEHFCSAATQMIMSQLYPYIFDTERVGKKMVAACVGGELHEIGIRMVSDFFEMEGWDTYYLGANAPTTTIMKSLVDNGADLLALSIAMPYHGRILREAIEHIREHAEFDHVKIMVGGNAMNRRNGDYQAFGADGYAASATQAVETGSNWFN